MKLDTREDLKIYKIFYLHPDPPSLYHLASLPRYTAILFKMKLRKLYGTKRKKDNYAMTDLTFLVVFPILFLAFNILYWTGVYWTRTF